MTDDLNMKLCNFVELLDRQSSLDGFICPVVIDQTGNETCQATYSAHVITPNYPNYGFSFTSPANPFHLGGLG